MDVPSKLEPERVDIRLAITSDPLPNGKPQRMLCPMHKDRQYSLMVYPGNVHCMGCGFHLKRRYESLAFVLGLWDGRGDATRAAKEARGLAHLYLGDVNREADKKEPDPLNMAVAVAYMVNLWVNFPGRVDYFQGWRGLGRSIMEKAMIGYDTCHWTIPVINRGGELLTIRYRLDDTAVEKGSKYRGVEGRNGSYLYPENILQEYINENGFPESLWVVEGEFDALSLWSIGIPAVTVTNGAGQVPKILGLIDARFGSIPKLIIATDQDDAGNEAAELLARGCMAINVQCVRAKWEKKDISEFLQGGGLIEEVTYEQFHRVVGEGAGGPGREVGLGGRGEARGTVRMPRPKRLAH